MRETKLHPNIRMGHVHLRVADLERGTAFYRDVLGFDVMVYGPDFGLTGAAFLSAGGYHHHIGLNTWTSEGSDPPPHGHTGLHHVAFVYLNRRELGRAVRRLDKMDEQREELMKTKEETASKEIRSLLDDAAGHAVRFLEGLPERGAASTATVGELRSALGGPLPGGPRDPRAGDPRPRGGGRARSRRLCRRPILRLRRRGQLPGGAGG